MDNSAISSSSSLPVIRVGQNSDFAKMATALKGEFETQKTFIVENFDKIAETRFKQYEKGQYGEKQSIDSGTFYRESVAVVVGRL